MTDLSVADAARLARIRRDFYDAYSDGAVNFLLRLLDAKPAGEFVTRQLHQRMIDGYRRQLSDSVDGHEAAWLRAEAAEAERDRLGTALATAQARIEEARAHLGAALVQLLPSDDAIISDHIRMARRALSPATGTGSMPATQKGTGSPASDTGNRGGGASLAAAPSDYEAVCGSCGRPTP